MTRSDITRLVNKHKEYYHDGWRYRTVIDTERVIDFLTEHLTMKFLPNLCTAVITRVVDGDTYVAEYDGSEYVVRLLGADCFETRYSAKLRKQALRHNISLAEAVQRGRAATHFAESVLLGEVVKLVRPEASPDNDAYFRHLRIVSVMWKNKQTDFAMLLRERGHDELTPKKGSRFLPLEGKASAPESSQRLWKIAYSFE